MGTPSALEECHSKLERVLKGMVQIKDDLVVTLRKEKCQFEKEEVRWFGHVFSKQGMSPDSE